MPMECMGIYRVGLVCCAYLVVATCVVSDEMQEMLELSKAYNKALEDEKTMTSEQKALKNVGKQVRHFSLPLSLCFNPFHSSF